MNLRIRNSTMKLPKYKTVWYQFPIKRFIPSTKTADTLVNAGSKRCHATYATMGRTLTEAVVGYLEGEMQIRKK